MQNNLKFLTTAVEVRGTHHMENMKVLSRVKAEGRSFLNAAAETNELAYLVLLTLYVVIYFLIKAGWVASAERVEETVKFALLGVVMWGSALYLFFVIVKWKNLWNNIIALIFVAGVILFATYYFSKNMSTNAYGVVMDIFFCLMACGKDYRKIIRCILCVTIVMLLIVGIGVPLGYTLDLGKPETVLPGHSLGINYPNTWGYLVFLGLMSFWYLYLQSKHIITFIVFWSISAFMYYYIICRTIAGITLVFPVLALLVDYIEKRADKKAIEGTFKPLKPLRWLFVSSPFIAFAFMMINSMAVNWWHKYYHGKLRNLAWRFIQGGLYFRTYGLPIVGNPYRSNQYTYVNVQGEFIKVGILDSSFAAYIIMRGMLWLLYTLLLLCIALWKAIKKRDYAIILIEIIMLGFAMMERPGLEMWYNFVLLYPLAKVVSKPGTEPVLEFPKRAEDTSIGEEALMDVELPETEQTVDIQTSDQT